MSLVHLIGTFHSELAGIRLMNAALSQLQPDILIGEANDFLDAKDEYRGQVWDRLFEELSVPGEYVRKFDQISRTKEHFFSKMYAKKIGCPYHMIDLPEKFTQDDLDEYAEVERLNKTLAMGSNFAKAVITQYVEMMFNGYLHSQDYSSPCARLYEDEFVLSEDSVASIGPRDEHMAKKLIALMEDEPDKRIVGFIGILYLIDPESDLVLEVLGKPLKNLRYFLKGHDVAYSKLNEYLPE